MSHNVLLSRASVPAGIREPRAYPRLLDALPASAFLLLALPLGLFLALVTPAGQVADEAAHISKAVSLLGGQVIGRRREVQLANGQHMVVAGVDVDPAASFAAASMRNEGGSQQVTRELLERARGIPWSGGRTFQAIGPIAGYFPVFYVPAAVAIAAGKALGAGPLQCVIFARLANAILYAALGTLALLFARRGRALLFCTLSVPMALSLGASINQDGLMIATTVLAAALLSWSWEAACTPARRAYIAAAMLLACVVVAKPPYLPLGVMLLLPLPSRLRWRSVPAFRRRVWTMVAVAALAISWTLLVAARATAPVPTDPYLPGPLWPGDPQLTFTVADAKAQLSVLRAHPWEVLELPLRTIAGDVNVVWAIIGVLGWLNVWLPNWLYWAWIAGVVGAALADLCLGGAAPDERRWTGLAGALLLIAGALACVEAVYVSQYLVWTHVGLERIDGPQGRYFLPMVPLLALALPRFAVPGAPWLRSVLFVVPLAAAFADNLVLPTVMLTLFHTP
jgi:uncharacterized membrane protein